MTTTQTLTTQTPTVQTVAAALAAAYSAVPSDWIAQRPRKALVVEAFNNARDALGSSDAQSYVVRELAADVDRIIGGTDPRGGSFHDQARAVADRIARALARTFDPEYAHTLTR